MPTLPEALLIINIYAGAATPDVVVKIPMVDIDTCRRESRKVNKALRGATRATTVVTYCSPSK